MRVAPIGRVVAAAALVLVGAGAALRPAPTALAAETCFGQPATIVGSGVIAGTPGNDVIVGSPRNDVIETSGGHDLICSGDGDDVITISRITSFFLDAGPGNDWISVSGQDSSGQSLEHMNVLGGPGNDQIEISHGVGFVRGGPGNDVVRGTATPCCFMEVHGDEGNDELAVQGPADLFGGAGNDRLENTSPNREGGIRLFGDDGLDVCNGPTIQSIVGRVRGCEVTSGNVQPA